MSSDERATLGANGRRYFEAQFDRELLVDRLLEHLASAIAARGGAK
jgi:hypothetical protein